MAISSPYSLLLNVISTTSKTVFSTPLRIYVKVTPNTTLKINDKVGQDLTVISLRTTLVTIWNIRLPTKFQSFVNHKTLIQQDLAYSSEYSEQGNWWFWLYYFI